MRHTMHLHPHVIFMLYIVQVSYPIVKSRTFTKSTASLSSMSAQSLRTTPPRHLNLDPAGPGDSEAAASRKVCVIDACATYSTISTDRLLYIGTMYQ